jgi:sulfur relay (sulfurtransferase) DsrF/TusC family protein
VYVNKQALRYRGIDDAHFDHAAEAVGEDRIVELLAEADRYVAY